MCVHWRLVAASPSTKPSGHRRKMSDASTCANMATGEGSDKGKAERGRAVTFRDRRGWREQRGGAEEQQREERPHWETAAVAVANGGGGAGVEWKWVCVQTDGVGKRKGGVVGEGRQGTGCQPATRRHPPRCSSFFSLCRAGRTRSFPRSFRVAGWLPAGSGSLTGARTATARGCARRDVAWTDPRPMLRQPTPNGSSGLARRRRRFPVTHPARPLCCTTCVQQQYVRSASFIDGRCMPTETRYLGVLCHCRNPPTSIDPSCSTNLPACQQKPHLSSTSSRPATVHVVMTESLKALAAFDHTGNQCQLSSLSRPRCWSL
jgi:hypothetical protein